jgi:hypothetical protein
MPSFVIDLHAVFLILRIFVEYHGKTYSIVDNQLNLLSVYQLGRIFNISRSLDRSRFNDASD